MARQQGRLGESELRAALMRLRGGLLGIAALSAVVNVLTLAGSIYLMLVYDRVLPGQSLPTLWSIFLMIGAIGAIVLLVFYCLPGTPGDNRYGPNPYGSQGTAAAV